MNLLVILSLIASPLRGADRPSHLPVITGAKNRFGLSLFQELVASQLDENVVISPYSITTALSMTLNGAVGETRTVMLRTLGYTGMEPDGVNVSERHLSDSLHRTEQGITLEIANSIWMRKGFGFKPAFKKKMREFYSADIFNLDFNLPEAPDRINLWVSQKTHNKIRSIVNRINPEHALFLINAIYFKGQWQQPFDPLLTDEGKFHLPDGKTIPVKMMHRSGKFRYLAEDGFAAVELPYGKGRVSMYLLLPDEQIGLKGLLERLTMENWSTWRALFESQQGHIALPRFRIEYEQSLKPGLIKLGMETAFDPNRANFSGMSPAPGLAIGDVKHKSFIEVNEEGTEAAAVTSVEMVMTAIPVKTFNLVFDRPFLFIIQENTTGTILFLGTVCQPGI